MNPDNPSARFAFTGTTPSELRIRSLRGAMVTACAGAIDVVLRIESTLVLARLLVSGHIGLISALIAVTRIAENRSSMGLYTAIVHAPKMTYSSAATLPFRFFPAGGYNCERYPKMFWRRCGTSIPGRRELRRPLNRLTTC